MVDSLDKISGLRIVVGAIVFVGILSTILVVSFLSTFGSTSSVIASGSVQSIEESEQGVVQILKDSMTSYNILNNETEYMGPFDTSYTISGESESLLASHDAIISAILDDFDRSPTIGYIKAGNFSTSRTNESSFADSLTIANPFTDLATINQTISQEVSNAIRSADGLDVPLVYIKCEFDMNIEDWKCLNESLS